MQKHQMKKPRIYNKKKSFLRAGIMLAAAGLLWIGYEDSSVLHPLIHISRQTVLDKYTEEYALDAAQNRDLEEIAFHQSFSGQEGEAFYVVWQKPDDRNEVEKYRIPASEASPGYEFQYQTVFNNITLPQNQFVVFVEEDGTWQQKIE